MQDADYLSLLRRTRQYYHRQVAELLESRFAEIVEAQPELVAHHLTEAGMAEPAIAYWQQAGERAAARSANAEAVEIVAEGKAEVEDNEFGEAEVFVSGGHRCEVDDNTPRVQCQ